MILTIVTGFPTTSYEHLMLTADSGTGVDYHFILTLY